MKKITLKKSKTLLLMLCVGIGINIWLVQKAAAQNGRIAFRSYRSGNEDIYSMRDDGTQPTRLTDHPARDYSPSFSLDGRKIAFISERDGAPEIYVMNYDGTNQTRLTYGTLFPPFPPKISPDGSKVAFIRNWFDICIINTDGTNETLVVRESTPVSRVAFHPDGTRIGFVSQDYSLSYNLYTINLDGSNRQLLNNVNNVFSPSFNFDGSRITFYSWDSEAPPFTNYEIFVMNADGTGKLRLTNDSPNSDWDPVFSPDGSKIAYWTVRGGNAEIYAMNADGTNPVNLTNDPGADFEPTWANLYPAPLATCVQGAGYWKSNPQSWSVSSLILGSQTYTRTELITILDLPIRSGRAADASLILARQLIAAKLSIAAGADWSPIGDELAAADALLAAYPGKLPYAVAPVVPNGQSMTALATALENFSSGTTPTVCGNP